ncbi:MAG: GAF domain-containing protein [Candidatus Rokubacteria bacterium]|nr:GAF domain-containing protein [Candidatus Rokubacteria bacterium]
MTPHQLVPLVAFALNVSLALASLLRNPNSRLNRVFAYFAAGMAVWNLGSWGLRRSFDEPGAMFWEVVIHAGVIMLPAFYYHFVLIFLDSTTRHRPSLVLAYACAAVLGFLNLVGSPLFIRGVKDTYWGWAPDQGPAYTGFLLYLNTFLVWGLVHLARSYRAEASSFRRNRALLILLGTSVSLAGGLIDFSRFMLARVWPEAEHLYPVGIPANAAFALLLGTSIVRYRLFDVSVFVKKGAVYVALAAGVTAVIGGLTWSIESYYRLRDVSAVWALVPVTFVMTLLLSPFGSMLEDVIQRVMFAKRRGCYHTLLDLSKRMITILDFGKLVDELVRGLVRGVPLTHATLLIWDATASAYVPYRQEKSLDEDPMVPPIRSDGPVVGWLQRTSGILVKEEVKLDPKIATFFEGAEGDVEELPAAVIVPLKVEAKLIGILLLGDKLSGDIFDAQELEVLSVLANQAAISLENARLYEGLSQSNARLMEASRLKSQFLASMSHELRTPLNSVIGFSKVLLNRLDGDLNERQDAYIRSVYNSSTHLLGLINTILDFSRVEAGKIEMHPEDVDLPELVEECVASSLPLVRDRRIKLETDVPVDVPPIRADRTKVRQILLNFLSNAVKFTTEGRIVVKARPEGAAMHVSVADTGIGIRASDLERLFEPFHRLDSRLAREAGGTGLGLAISKRFVELHGGRVWAESRENQGSTFHFTLPLAAGAATTRSH